MARIRLGKTNQGKPLQYEVTELLRKANCRSREDWAKKDSLCHLTSRSVHSLLSSHVCYLD